MRCWKQRIQAKKEGIDVVVGYVEPHARPDTLALLAGLEVLPNQMIDYRGIQLREFDLDQALQRKPQLILVDELAHNNAQGCGTQAASKTWKSCFKPGSMCIPQ